MRIKMHTEVRGLKLKQKRNDKSKRTNVRYQAWLVSFNLMRSRLKQGINNHITKEKEIKKEIKKEKEAQKARDKYKITPSINKDMRSKIIIEFISLFI